MASFIMLFHVVNSYNIRSSTMNKDMKDAVILIEKICNVNAMTNKWIMWADRAFHEQSSFSFSIYQLRDAFSHMMSMYTYGFVNRFLNSDNPELKSDWEGFYSDSETYHQLKDTFGHVTRAFFDCADFICVLLSDSALKKEENVTFLRLCLTRYSEDIEQPKNRKI